jgi:hypothetical protein
VTCNTPFTTWAYANFSSFIFLRDFATKVRHFPHTHKLLCENLSRFRKLPVSLCQRTLYFIFYSPFQLSLGLSLWFDFNPEPFYRIFSTLGSPRIMNH